MGHRHHAPIALLFVLACGCSPADRSCNFGDELYIEDPITGSFSEKQFTLQPNTSQKVVLQVRVLNIPEKWPFADLFTSNLTLTVMGSLAYPPDAAPVPSAELPTISFTVSDDVPESSPEKLQTSYGNFNAGRARACQPDEDCSLRVSVDFIHDQPLFPEVLVAWKASAGTSIFDCIEPDPPLSIEIEQEEP